MKINKKLVCKNKSKENSLPNGLINTFIMIQSSLSKKIIKKTLNFSQKPIKIKTKDKTAISPMTHINH